MAMTNGDLAAHLANWAGKILPQVRASGLLESKSLGWLETKPRTRFFLPCPAPAVAGPVD